ncbi:AAA family ATPase [Vibrio fluvialis]|uniref:AAA family ATPase n=1 Tax=Vibrio fluvialis TaxID=676 RepID=UPI001F48FA84|nr:AAA family ATPase [Vibrio fluvialis]MCE7661338.1 AAA family ATPase [Vibrio fluvialis]
MEYYIRRVRVNGLFNENNNLTVDFEKGVNCIYGYNGTGKTVLINLIVHALNANVTELRRIPFDSLTILISKKKQAEKFISVFNRPEGINYIFHMEIQESLTSWRFGSQIQRRRMSIEKETPYSITTRPLDPRDTSRITPMTARILIKNVVSTTFVPLVRANLEAARRNQAKYIDGQEIEYKNTLLSSIQDEFSRQYASAQSNIARKLESLSSDILEKLFLSPQDNNHKKYSHEINQLLDRGQPESHNSKMKDVTTQIRDLKLDIPIQIIEDHYKTWEGVQNELIQANEEYKNKPSDIDSVNRYSAAYINFATTFGMYKKLQDAISQIEVVYHKKYLSLNKFEKFKSAINEFLSDNKKFNFDDDGTFNFTHNGKPVQLEHLSSGEQQLIAILGRLCTATDSSSTFIADEPELSLHLEWQRKILPTIKNLSPDTQIIVATHSPAIISKESHKIDIEECYTNE